MRIVFMGTPDFAVPTLTALVEGGHEVIAAVTQPDKPKGRGKSVLMTPVKEKALEYKIPVYQPVKVRDSEFVDLLKVMAPDVVLMKSRLSDVPAAIRLSRATLRNIHENLFWAFFYNVIGIPLAMGLWIPVFGWKLNPMFGAAAMSLSSFCVVSNALRLNFFDIRRSDRDKKIKTKTHKEEKESKTMEKTLKVEGMMCPHCEAAVKKALEAIDGVSVAEADHVKGTATVTLTKDVPTEVLKKAIEDKDYKVID